MEGLAAYIKWGFAAAGGVVGAFLGGLDGILTALCIFVATDFATGIAAACVEGKLSSRVSFAGIAKKLCIFLLVGIANTIDVSLIGGGSAVRTATVFFYLAGEGISMLENCARIGLPIPQKIKDALGQITDNS